MQLQNLNVFSHAIPKQKKESILKKNQVKEQPIYFKQEPVCNSF